MFRECCSVPYLKGCSDIQNVVTAHRYGGSLIGLIVAGHVEAQGRRQSPVMVHIVNVAACHAAIFFCRCDANRVADADIACEDGLVLRARPKRVIAGDAQTA